MKKVCCFLSCLLAISSCALNNLFRVSATNTSDWVSRCVADIKIYDVDNGIHVTGLSSWGCRIGTVSKIKLDGLTFDYILNNPLEGQLAGFYFSSFSTDRFNPQDADTNDIITFTFNPAYGSQVRFGIFPNHDILGKNKASSRNVSTPNPDKPYDAFGYDDGTLIMNRVSPLGLRFKLDKYDDTFYKLSITELTQNTIWGSSYHLNYDNGTVTTYIRLSQLELDELGQAYMFVYGGATNCDEPDIYIKNMKSYQIVNFNTNGGTLIDPLKVEKGKCIEEPIAPKKDHVLFQGWYIDQELTVPFDFSNPVNSDLTLYAKWKLIDDVNPPIIDCNINNLEVVEGTKPDESFKAYDEIDGYVPISYIYPAGALDEFGRLKLGTYVVTLKAVDTSKNMSTHELTYNVIKGSNNKISHFVKINSQGCNVDIAKEAFYPDDEVIFNVTDFNSQDDINIEIIDSDNNNIEYNGTNPYSFKMPNKQVTINAINKSSTYILKSKVDATEGITSYTGRHYIKDNGVFLSYSNSGFIISINVLDSVNCIVANITGSTSISTGETSQYIQAYVDNVKKERITIQNGTNNVVLLKNLTIGEHLIEFKKCNEAQFSNLILNNLQFDGIAIKKYIDNRPLLEIYGDSITCGYGTLSKSNQESFLLSTEDSTISYSELLAEKLNYRTSTISYSGIALYKSWTDSPYNMMNFYDELDGHKYNMRKDTPKIAIINLGTNDNAKYASLTSEEEKRVFENGFETNLKKLMTSILNNNIYTKIVFCYEMMTQISDKLKSSALSAINKVKENMCTNNIFAVGFTPDVGAADGHPSAEAHRLNSEILYNYFIDNNLL